MGKYFQTYKDEVRSKIENKEPITLMHLWLMVFEQMDHGRYAPRDKAGPFLNQVLCSELKKKIEYISGSDREIDERRVYPIMRKEYKDSYLPQKSEVYDNIYKLLNTNPDHAPFLYLNEQYDTLKHLEANPNKYAVKLWNAILAKRDEYGKQTYMEVLNSCSPWLFKNHEKELEEFDVERTYRLLTVAIAISLNQNTCATEELNDPLDELCKKFLFSCPPEELPAFTLRDVFDTLFPDDDKFAVKRSRDGDYVMVKWDDVTERDKLCILLPWLDIQYDLHTNSEETAKAVLDNTLNVDQIGKDIADRLQGFFLCFSSQPDVIWNQFIAHLKESLLQCSRVEHWKRKQKAKIDELLKRELPTEEIPSYSERYLDILCTDSQWNRIACDKFWDGDQVSISLPTDCGNEDDAQQLYQYIAAYILIALCCLKPDDPNVPEKRKIYKEKLMQKIHNPTSIPIERYEEVKRENETLKRTIAEKQREKADMTNMFRELVNGLLFLLRMSASVDLREFIKGQIRNVIPYCGYTHDEMVKMEEILEAAKSLVRKNDSHDWDNGGK